MKRTAEDSYAPLRALQHSFARFHDCWKSPSTPGVSLWDCYVGMQRAIASGFYNFETFNVQEYARCEIDSNVNGNTDMICDKKWQMVT